MKILFSHLSEIISSKHPPVAVSLAISRRFEIETLKMDGFHEHELEEVDYETLDQLWHNTFLMEGEQKYKISFRPRPGTYTLGMCYIGLFLGLTELRSTVYQAMPGIFRILASNGQVLKEIRNEFLLRDANKALIFIGQADPILPHYLKSMAITDESTVLEFTLSEENLDMLGELYRNWEQKPKHRN
jgi:hypothetical protein